MSLDRLQNVFREVFGIPDLVVTSQTTAADVTGWDSFAHINLIIALEGEFGITFTAEEIAGMTSVGDLVGILQSRSIEISW